MTIEDRDDTIELMILVTGTLMLLDVVVFSVVLSPVEIGDIDKEGDEVGGTKGVVVCFESVVLVGSDEEEEGMILVVGIGVFGETIEEMEDTIELMMLVTGTVGVGSVELKELVRVVVEAFDVATDEDEEDGVEDVKLVVGSVFGETMDDRDETIELMMLVTGVLGVVKRVEELVDRVLDVFGLERSVEELVRLVRLVVGRTVFGETTEERDDTIEVMMLVTGRLGVDRSVEFEELASVVVEAFVAEEDEAGGIKLVVGTGVLGDTTEETEDRIELMMLDTGAVGVDRCVELVASVDEEDEEVKLVVGTGVFGDTIEEERDERIELMVLVGGSVGVGRRLELALVLEAFVVTTDDVEAGVIDEERVLVVPVEVFGLTIEDRDETIELMILVTGTLGVLRRLELVATVDTEEFAVATGVFGEASEEESDDTIELMIVVAGTFGVV